MTSTPANLGVIDTPVYIDNLRSGRFKQEVLDLGLIVRCSAVVLAELSRGARSSGAASPSAAWVPVSSRALAAERTKRRPGRRSRVSMQPLRIPENVKAPAE